MSKPKLSTKTPDTIDTNSLIGRHDDIIAMPKERRFALVELAAKDVRTIVADGDQQATLQLVHIELLEGKYLERGTKLFDEVYQQRTGNKTRPAPGEENTPLDGLGDVSLDDGIE